MRSVRTWAELLGPLLEGEGDVVRGVLTDALRSGTSRCALYEELVMPCLREVGALWQRGEISVPDEHLASMTLMAVLNGLQSPPVTAPDAPTAVVSCAPRENHTLPAVMAADVLSDAGWRVWQLGGSAPAGELAAFVRRRAPRLLVLTTTMARTAAGVTTVTRPVRAGGGPAILVGGAGVRDVAAPAAVGADAVAHRLGSLLTFADDVLAHEATCDDGPPLPPADEPARLTVSSSEVELLLLEAGSSLSMNEISEACGASTARVGAALARLERTDRVRFVGGRWSLVAPRPGHVASARLDAGRGS